jgi:hypothetical protein
MPVIKFQILKFKKSVKIFRKYCQTWNSIQLFKMHWNEKKIFGNKKSITRASHKELSAARERFVKRKFNLFLFINSFSLLSRYPRHSYSCSHVQNASPSTSGYSRETLFSASLVHLSVCWAWTQFSCVIYLWFAHS